MDWAHLAGAGGWNKLFDRYYRKQEIYEMSWSDVDLSKMIVAGSPFAGPFAMLRDDKKISLISAGSLRPTLNIYSSSGSLLASIPAQWKTGRVVEMGWTSDEKLIVVLDDGTVMQFSAVGRLIQTFSMGEEFRTDRVLLCCIWGSGVVCLSRSHSLVFVDNFEEPIPRRMPRLGDIASSPTCMVIIEPSMTQSKGLEVLLAVDKTILVVDMTGVEDQKLTAGPIRRMSVCPNGKMLACFTHDGFVWVITTDFSKNLSEFPTKSQVPPLQLVWCGTDSVVLYWDKIVLMIGPYGDWVKYAYDEAVFLLPEMDGVRIISSSRCEFLHRVPDSVVDIFKIGSCTPGAILFDALELLEKNDAKADENIRGIRDSLPEAISVCLDAASHEFSVELQKQLLKAASYGSCFLEAHRPTRMVNVLSSLRMLNMIREPRVGLPLTFPQLQSLSPQTLVLRLAQRQQHYLALQICEHMGLKKTEVLVHWACEMIRRGGDLTDKELYDAILARLPSSGHISLAEVAATAYAEQRTELANLLLDNEPKAGEQVPLLISMKEEKRALVKALESGDPDLVFLAMLHMQKSKTTSDFFQSVLRHQTAKDLMLLYSKQQDHTLLRQLCQAMEAPHEAGSQLLLESFKAPDVTRRRKGMELAMSLFSQSKDESAKLMAKHTEEQIRLQEAQLELEQATGRSVFFDTSASETVRLCFVYNQHSRGLRIAKDMKFSEKLLWSLKVSGLAEGHDWKELEKFSKERKTPPIGFELFVEACIRENRFDEGMKYAMKMTDMARKSELCVRMGMLREAAEAAVQARDRDMLLSVRSKCTNPSDMAIIDNLVAHSGL
uniref:Vacuolar protein sorting-associated protein 16 homolog n=1 Tax=Guillardia theta TaxID=55529 RepID=A0A7S4PFI6_GUITH|mmetsp:Transcript_49877/g.156096  ORF Transcript_49877/g.156096 Transcript_49877/m.156096 type:complete len:832 (+) Transcript_49877:163-2658(+)